MYAAGLESSTTEREHPTWQIPETTIFVAGDESRCMPRAELRVRSSVTVGVASDCDAEKEDHWLNVLEGTLGGYEYDDPDSQSWFEVGFESARATSTRPTLPNLNTAVW